MYSGMILATWYKKALKESLLGKIYADKAKVKGVDQDPKINETIYQRYLKAFKKGVFNYIKEDVDKYTNEEIPRKYFSGGFTRLKGAIEVIHKGQRLPLSRAMASIVKENTMDQASIALDENSLQRPAILQDLDYELGVEVVDKIVEELREADNVHAVFLALVHLMRALVDIRGISTESLLLGYSIKCQELVDAYVPSLVRMEYNPLISKAESFVRHEFKKNKDEQEWFGPNALMRIVLNRHWLGSQFPLDGFLIYAERQGGWHFKTYEVEAKGLYIDENGIVRGEAEENGKTYELDQPLENIVYFKRGSNAAMLHENSLSTKEDRAQTITLDALQQFEIYINLMDDSILPDSLKYSSRISGFRMMSKLGQYFHEQRLGQIYLGFKILYDELTKRVQLLDRDKITYRKVISIAKSMIQDYRIKLGVSQMEEEKVYASTSLSIRESFALLGLSYAENSLPLWEDVKKGFIDEIESHQNNPDKEKMIWIAYKKIKAFYSAAMTNEVSRRTAILGVGGGFLAAAGALAKSSENPYLALTLNPNAINVLIREYQHKLKEGTSLKYIRSKHALYYTVISPSNGELGFRFKNQNARGLAKRIFKVVGFADRGEYLYVAQRIHENQGSAINYIKFNNEGKEEPASVEDIVGLDWHRDIYAGIMRPDEILARIEGMTSFEGTTLHNGITLIKPKDAITTIGPMKNILGLGVSSRGNLYIHNWYENTDGKPREQYYMFNGEFLIPGLDENQIPLEIRSAVKGGQESRAMTAWQITKLNDLISDLDQNVEFVVRKNDEQGLEIYIRQASFAGFIEKIGATTTFYGPGMDFEGTLDEKTDFFDRREMLMAIRRKAIAGKIIAERLGDLEVFGQTVVPKDSIKEAKDAMNDALASCIVEYLKPLLDLIKTRQPDFSKKQLNDLINNEIRLTKELVLKSTSMRTIQVGGQWFKAIMEPISKAMTGVIPAGVQEILNRGEAVVLALDNDKTKEIKANEIKALIDGFIQQTDRYCEFGLSIE